MQGGTQNNESNLFENLIIESIKQYGFDVQYMPRTEVAFDTLYADDPLSSFNTAPTIEMYIKNVNGMDGEGDFLSRFGLEIRDQMTLTVARKRFDQFQSEKLTTETGSGLLLENGGLFELETDTAEGYTVSLTRPEEGDLIFFPLTGKVYEVKFVEHESVFYQLGNLYVYDINVELYEYSSERFDTGNVTIDGIEDKFSTDLLNFELLLENGDKLVKEDGDSFILEQTNLSILDVQSDNEFFDEQVRDEDIIDFSETNPFSE